MHKHRWFIIAAVALAAAAALFRLRPSAEAQRSVWSPAVLNRVATSGEAAQVLPNGAGWERADARRSRPEVVVYLTGAVKRPGVYRFGASARLEAAVRGAGGLTPAADPIGVNLAQPLRDGEEIVVPERGSPQAQRASAADGICSPPRRRGRKRSSYSSESRRRTAAGLITGSDASFGAAPGNDPSRVDVNHADAAELATLPGIGPHLAERIVAFRRSNGPFGRLDEMLDVNGVTEHVLDAIEPYLIFGR